MAQAIFILSFLAAAFWALLLLLPSQRRAAKFVYNVESAPDVLNGVAPNDDVCERYAGDPQQWPSVTVVVPGRNEGHLLASTLGSLCEMQYSSYRVVFVDDQSTDNTAEVCRELAMRHPHLTVLHNTKPPEDGWVGKPWAVHQAERFMHESDYLLFTDSDLHFHPQCLRQMVRLALHRQSDIMSSLPLLKYETIGELLGILPAMVLINARLSLYRVNDSQSPQSLVAGGFLLAKRASYEAMGGHAAVRGQVIEDIALGKRAKAKGFRVYTVCTHDLYSARMYEGWRDTYRGLKKNAYAGVDYKAWLIIPTVLFFLGAGALLPLYALLGILFWITSPSLWTFGAMAAAIASNALLLTAGRHAAAVLGIPKNVAWYLPAGFAFYCAIFIGSVWDFYRGGNEWAGRRIASHKVESLASISKEE